MTIAVMGAGSVGRYGGGMLTRAGHRVVLIAGPAHVATITQHGLRLQTMTFAEQVVLSASTASSALKGVTLVLLGVKSPDTEATGVLICPLLPPDALVLCLENGVDNADRLRTGLPQHTVAAAVVYVAAELAAGQGKRLSSGAS